MTLHGTLAWEGEGWARRRKSALQRDDGTCRGRGGVDGEGHGERETEIESE